MLSKQTKRKLLLFFLPRIVWALLWVLYLTSRRRFHLHEAMMHKNFVAAFWHGEFLMLPFLYRYAKKQMGKERAKGFYIISSQHFDGEIMVKLYKYFGLDTLRGSSSKGGLKVLIESIQLLKQGYDMGITPDGPKGPYHSIADGVIAMSQKTGVPIVPVYVSRKKYWFRRSPVIIGKPITPKIAGRKATSEELEKIMNDVMEQIYQLGETA